MSKEFPIYLQQDAQDCGISCLRMICKFYGKTYSSEHLRSIIIPRADGISLLEISEGAEQLGFKSFAARITFDQLQEKVPLPCIVHWDKNHYVVVYKISKKRVWIADPAHGLRQLSIEEFKKSFLSINEEDPKGICLLLENTETEESTNGKSPKLSGKAYLWKYLSQNKLLFIQLLLGLLFTIVLQLVFPLLIMGVVDEGIEGQDFDFVKLVIIAWGILYLSQVLVEHIRKKLFLQIGARTNLSLVSDFLIKLFKLPLNFFSSRHTTDITRRLYDGERVERLLTTSFIPSSFAVLGILLSAAVLAYFDLTIFLIFIIGLSLYYGIVILFLDKRKNAEYDRFDKEFENQLKLEEIVNGIQDIRLNNAETIKRWDWERSEAQLFKQELNFSAIDQSMELGTKIVNELKNIVITCLAAYAVIEGNMSLGALFAIQYITGQMNAPVKHLKQLIIRNENARLSLDRLSEVSELKEEERGEKFKYIPEHGDIELENISFQHNYSNNNRQLKNITLNIQRGKTTAIVGSSGSGKTTLLKLLLGVNKSNEGQIRIGNTNLNSLDPKSWYKTCSYVLQDSYIFSNSIADNIAISDSYIDEVKLRKAAQLANINRFIEDLPMGYHTPIGKNGMGLSQGQIQRILLARAFYKNGDFLFLDEATSALDAYNEMLIMDSIKELFGEKTIVLVSHRLNTVKFADKIIVLEAGELVEEGTHEELIRNNGAYYRLFSTHIEI